MWREIRHDRDGRVRRWQPTLPRLAAFAAAAGLSFLVARPGPQPAPPTVVAPPQAQPAPAAPCDQDPPFVVLRGRYVNFNYGYSVDIPDERFAFTVSPPCPQHGCVIDLEDTGRFVSYTDIWRRLDVDRRMSVDGSYNAASVPTLDEEIDNTVGWKREKTCGLRVLARTRTTLGGLGAVCVTVEYEDCATHETRIEERVVAGRRWPGDGTKDDGRRVDDVRYTAWLTTTPNHRAEDERAFAQLLHSWRLRAAE
jgi:hypothetical protein